MKRNASVFLESVALSMLSAWGAVGCLTSAFSLTVANPQGMMLLWVCWALLCACLLGRRWGIALLLALGALGAGYLWHDGRFGQQLLSLLGVLAKAYDAGYGWGIPQVLQVERLSPDLPVTVLGMLLIFAVSVAVCRRKGNALAVFLLLVPLACCLVVTDTVPEELFLFLLLLCLCLLLLTDGVRRENGPQAGRLTAIALVPLALGLGLLLHFYPRETYVNTTQALRERLTAAVMELPQQLEDRGFEWLTGLGKKQTVELSSLPSQQLLGIPVAELTAEQSGAVYLRVQDYDVYTGTAWESTSGRQDTLAGTGEERGMVTVKPLAATDAPLLPAFPEGQTFLTDGAGENEQGQQEYTAALRSASMGAFPSQQWLKLPAETSRRAKELLQGLPGEKETVEQTVQILADYVRSCAAYDRGGTSMPTGETDFALWFLEQGEQGYCVHFATAAAVLLRSAGIPARYVTGYRVEAQAGQTVQVTSDHAHAWVEYYNYRTWTWNILEATPADESLPPVEIVPETTQATQATQPQPQSTTMAATVGATQPAPTEQPVQTPEAGWQMPLWIPVTVLTVALFWILTEAQRLLRIGLRIRKQSKGNGNRQAVTIYQELRQLHLLLKRPMPEELLQLVEKAMFSQYLLTREELEVFLASQAACRRALRRAPWWKKLLYRYWFAVI